MTSRERIAEIDAWFTAATGWGSWMVAAANEREALVDTLRADGEQIEHRWQARTGAGSEGQSVAELILALRAALDRAEADKAAAVLAERERCIAAARAALDIRKAVYEAKGSDWNPELFKDMAMSQDYAFDAIEAAIRAQTGGDA